MKCTDCGRPRGTAEVDNGEMPDSHCWRDAGRYGNTPAMMACLREQVATARETNRRLNRRVQAAEGAAAAFEIALQFANARFAPEFGGTLPKGYEPTYAARALVDQLAAANERADREAERARHWQEQAEAVGAKCAAERAARERAELRAVEAERALDCRSGIGGVCAADGHGFAACAKCRIAEMERERDEARGIKPELPPRPPDGHRLPRYGLRWNGPQSPLAVPMVDGYWTPWHLADAAVEETLAASARSLESAVEARDAEIDAGALLMALANVVAAQHATSYPAHDVEPLDSCATCALLKRAREWAR